MRSHLLISPALRLSLAATLLALGTACGSPAETGGGSPSEPTPEPAAAAAVAAELEKSADEIDSLRAEIEASSQELDALLEGL